MNHVEQKKGALHIGWWYRILLLSLLFHLFTFSPLQAQRIRTIDKDGQPVPYVSVLTTDAKFIGITDLDGVIEDVKGADTISVSHVAYKPKLYKVNGKSGSITLEDADFGLPEIVVKKKQYVYVQTYYRMYYYDDEHGVAYYRVGLTDNAYDRTKKKLSASTSNTSKAKFGLLKTTLNTLLGAIMNYHSEIKTTKVEQTLLKNHKDIKLKITQESPGRKRVSDFKGTVGYITDNQASGERKFSVDTHKMNLHSLEAGGKAKKIAKQEKRDAKKKNKQDVHFTVYQIDEAGNYSPEDFVMSENMTSFDDEEDGKTIHKVIAIQVFTTDRAYVDKDELKQKKKENKMKMTYQNIRQFERANKIPALTPVIQKKLDELWKGEG